MLVSAPYPFASPRQLSRTGFRPPVTIIQSIIHKVLQRLRSHLRGISADVTDDPDACRQSEWRRGTTTLSHILELLLHVCIASLRCEIFFIIRIIDLVQHPSMIYAKGLRLAHANT